MADGEDSMAATVKRRRFTLDEYHRMGEIGSRHAGTVAKLHHLFSTRLGDRTVVWSQNPLLLVQHQSEPEPDIMLLAPRPDFYVARLPEPPDVQTDRGRGQLAPLRPPDEIPAVRA